jgi:hypothetical protein
MLVFWEERLVVLPTPKTGSTAVMMAVGAHAEVVVRNPPQLRHVTVQRYHTHVRPWLEGVAQGPFRVVALMREPESWLGSWFRYRKRDGVPAANSTRDISFDAFVRGWCQSTRPAFADVGSQERFLRPNHAGRWIDRLFRYEEMPDFAAFLQSELGIGVEFKTHNASPAETLTLSDATRALLREAAAFDYAMYRDLKPSRTL